MKRTMLDKKHARTRAKIARQKNKSLLRGFSLLEVMVALAILAISFTSLILVQGRATGLAVEARNISIATQLARLQLLECKREAQKTIASLSDFKLDGDFTDQGYAEFKWECHAPKFNMKTPSVTDVEKNVKANTPESAKKDTSATSAVSAPFLSMITDTLGTSVRELTTIVRWGEENAKEEMRVVTHIIDLTAMSALSRVLTQGAKTFEKSLGGEKKTETGKPEGANPAQPGAPQQPGPPGGFMPPQQPGGFPQGRPPGGFPPPPGGP